MENNDFLFVIWMINYTTHLSLKMIKVHDYRILIKAVEVKITLKYKFIGY